MLLDHQPSQDTNTESEFAEWLSDNFCQRIADVFTAVLPAFKSSGGWILK